MNGVGRGRNNCRKGVTFLGFEGCRQEKKQCRAFQVDRGNGIPGKGMEVWE